MINCRETIVYAALHYNDGKNHKKQPENIKSGFVIHNFRHKICLNILKKKLDKEIVNESSFGDQRIKKCFCRLITKCPIFVKLLKKITQVIFTSDLNLECGFITSKNRFVNRREGSKIAYNAGQIHAKVEFLHSEYIFPFSFKLDGFKIQNGEIVYQ